MSSSSLPEQRGGYAWPGADEEAVQLSCVRVARHLARSGVRRIGVLPVDRQGVGTGTLDLSPLLERLAGALAMFGGREAAFIGPWRQWGGPASDRGKGVTQHRQARPQVLEVVPRPYEDAETAAAALDSVLGSLPAAVSPILVDLGGYPRPQAIAVALEAIEGVVIAVITKRARIRGVAPSLRDVVPVAKRLGAILIDW